MLLILTRRRFRGVAAKCKAIRKERNRSGKRLERHMKKWRSTYPAIVALLALLASGLPSPAWSCPITKRVGDAAFVCQGMAQQCARATSACCKQVPVPQSGAVAVQSSQTAFAVLAKQSSNFVPISSVGDIQRLNAVLSRAHGKILRPRASVSARAAPSSGLCSQHGPPSFSGRAPPVVGGENDRI